MRIRSIKPEFWSSEDIATLGWNDRLLFLGLWSYVDDNGVGRDIPKLIVADLFPLEDDPRDTLATVSRGLLALSEAGRITRYTVDGKPFLHVTNWDKHQRIDKPNKPRYPAPTSGNAEIRDTLATPSRDSSETPAPGTGEQGNRGTGEQTPPTGEGQRKRAHTLPKGWMPSDESKLLIRGECPHVDLAAEHRKFSDYYEATGKPMKVWDSAWRNWMRRATTDTRTARKSRGEAQFDSTVASLAAWVAEEDNGADDRRAINQ